MCIHYLQVGQMWSRRRASTRSVWKGLNSVGLARRHNHNKTVPHGCFVAMLCTLWPWPLTFWPNNHWFKPFWLYRVNRHTDTQTDRITEADDRYTDATTVGVRSLTRNARVITENISRCFFFWTQYIYIYIYIIDSYSGMFILPGGGGKCPLAHACGRPWTDAQQTDRHE